MVLDVGLELAHGHVVDEGRAQREPDRRVVVLLVEELPEVDDELRGDVELRRGPAVAEVLLEHALDLEPARELLLVRVALVVVADRKLLHVLVDVRPQIDLLLAGFVEGEGLEVGEVRLRSSETSTGDTKLKQ